MNNALKIFLWDKEIGRLVWDKNINNTYFTYNPEFIRTGLEIAPLTAPVKGLKSRLPVYGEDDRKYQKLPAFLADSLPDDWGNRLFEQWRIEHRISNADITPLEKLSFIGKRGMGAFEFLPEYRHFSINGKIDARSLIDLARRIFNDRENVEINAGESLTMQALIAVGTSAGGRQPKAGIAIMDSALLDVEGEKHFLTRRFDRIGKEKLHTQTLAALCPGTDSYEKLLGVCREMRLPEKDSEEVFRRMIFNILANNTDDHDKNFTFVMDRKGQWSLSPAYDMTFIFNRGGFQPQEERCLMVRGKVSDITKSDVMSFAMENGIRRAEAIINKVAEAVMSFRETASAYNVRKEWINRIESCLLSRLEKWYMPKKTIFRKTVNAYWTGTESAI